MNCVSFALARPARAAWRLPERPAPRSLGAMTDTADPTDSNVYSYKYSDIYTNEHITDEELESEA